MRSQFPVYISSGSNFACDPVQLATYQKKYAWSADGCLQYVTGVIRNEVGAVLVGYNKKHRNRQIPSGKVDKWETLLNTLERELEEEIHLEVTQAELLGRSKVIYNGMVREGHFFDTEISGTLQAQERDTMEEFKRISFIPADNSLGRWLTDGTTSITDEKEILTTRHMFAELYRLLNFPGYHALMQQRVIVPPDTDQQNNFLQLRESSSNTLRVESIS